MKPTDPVYTPQAINNAKLNAPASTVLLFEGQGMDAALTNQNEVDSSSGNGGDCAGNGKYRPQGTSGSLGGNYRRYATGPIGTLPGQSDNRYNDFETPINGNMVSPGNLAVNPAVHTGGANYLLCDGHVKWELPQYVSGGATPNAQTGCAQDACVVTTANGATAGYPATDSSATTDKLGSPFVITFSPF